MGSNVDTLTSSELLDQLRPLERTDRVAWMRQYAQRNGELDLEQTLVGLGDEAERLALSDVARALETAALATELADDLGRGRSRARARRAHAQALAYAGRLDEALSMCAAARLAAERDDQPVEAARAMLASLHPLGELGRYDEAVEVGQAAYAALMAAGEPLLAARADINLGVIRQNQDAPAQALFHLDRARQVLADEPVLLGYVENNRGEALLLLNDFAGAEQAFRNALATAERTSSTVAAAIAEGNLADLAARGGRMHLALQYFERARRRLENDVAGSHLSRLMMEQAEALEALGLARQAHAAFLELIPRLEQHGVAAEIARAQAGLGKALLQLDDFSAARAALLSAQERYRSLKLSAQRARVEMLLAELALTEGALEEAAHYLELAAPDLQELPLDQAVLNRHAAALALSEGDVTAAGRDLERALAAIEGLDLAPLTADLLHLRGRIRRAAGRPELAIRDFREAIGYVERLRGALQAERFRAAFLGRRSSLYEEFVQALLDQPVPDVPAAFEAAEQARARALRELTRGVFDQPANGTVDPVEGRLLDEAARARHELSAVYSRLLEQRRRGREPAATEWREQIAMRERALQELETRLASTRGVGALYASPVTMSEVRDALTPDTAIVEYFISMDEVLAFVVRQDGVTVHRQICTREALDRLVERMRFQLARGLHLGRQAPPTAIEAARAVLHAGYSTLFAPLADRLEGIAAIWFVPAGPLHAVPLHAMWNGEAYLAERHRIAYAGSAGLLAGARRLKRDGGARLVVGVADEFAPQVEDEARAVGALLPGASILIGPEATVARVGREAARADLLHLACHGRFSPEHPLLSGLRLADRWMTVRDIYALDMSASLVVLSGCETGRALVQPGEELIGLTQAFLAGGARSMLVAQWRIADDFAADFMRRFYNRWPRRDSAGGLNTVSGALQATQIESMAAWPHPAHWSAFHLIGAL